ncbi:hypothetical protein LTR84_006167 [Exophiala bonariae]|uniref:DUF7702 domain-containing protein n=1 Tax=Exophiala bonariae TaxID=1690606 RepID=A0AAV9N1S2_9EURO|nr:hypothetical protein LTR84_006167 [Exophiala bonariae]
MGQFTYSDGVATGKLVYYIPALVASILVASRHGFRKSSGWIYLTIFCVIRIVGSVAQLILISNPSSDGASTTALICTVLGLAPLLLASLGLLARCYYSILKQPWSTVFSLFGLRAVQILPTVGLILSIVGATNANTAAEIDKQDTVKIGVVLFTVSFASICLLCGIASLLAKKTKGGEKRLIRAVAFALPFLLVRVIYSLVAMFGNRSDFSLGNGSTAAVTISLFMEVLEECAVVLIYVFTGLKLPTVPVDADEDGVNLACRSERGGFGSGKFGLFSLGAAVLGRATKKHNGYGDVQSR